MNKKLQFFLKSKFIFIICLFFLDTELTGQNIQWALKGTKDNKPFHEGLAEFYDTDSHKHGFINTSGEIVIPAKYESVWNFDSGMAVVEVEGDKKGIIDRNGRFVLQPIYYRIYPCDEASGMYSFYVEDNKEGLFYNGRVVLPPQYKSIYTWNYPFIEYISTDDVRKVINLVTGDVLDEKILSNPVTICEKGGIKYYFDKTTGERLDSTSLVVSSQGVMPFQDETTKLYGFKNQKTGSVIIPPKYKDISWGIWMYDAMIVRDSVNSNMPRKNKVVDCYGKEWDLCKTGGEWIVAEDNYYCVVKDTDNKYYTALYTKQGEELLQMTEQTIGRIEGADDWFNVWGKDKDNKVFDAKNRVFYPGLATKVCEDMLVIVNVNEHKGYYINAVKRNKLKGEYYSVDYFREGLAHVQFTENYYDKGFIDKKGNVVLRGSKNLRLGDYFSEGVVGASYEPDNYKEAFKGYIYNPLGHKGYSYKASDNMAVGNSVVLRWRDIADQAFEKRQYGKAKDYYYKIMMNKPDDTKALLGYGNCMNNLGYYDEAIECYQLALDIDPSFDLAQTNLNNSINNKKRREEREEMERVEQENQSAQSSTFWDALGSFASMLGNFSGATNTYQSYSSFSSDYDSGSKGGSSNYQSQYNMWTKRAESNYNSLTNLGYSTKSKSGKRSGGTLQSMSGGNYVLMKKNLRDAQREMRRIRYEAARQGVTIQQSSWETATVNY